MNRHNRFLMFGALVAVATAPIALWFALDAIPPLASIRTEANGNRLGPWVFTWGLVWIAIVGAALVAWLCYLSARLPESGSGRPNTNDPMKS